MDSLPSPWRGRSPSDARVLRHHPGRGERDEGTGEYISGRARDEALLRVRRWFVIRCLLRTCRSRHALAIRFMRRMKIDLIGIEGYILTRDYSDAVGASCGRKEIAHGQPSSEHRQTRLLGIPCLRVCSMLSCRRPPRSRRCANVGTRHRRRHSARSTSVRRPVRRWSTRRTGRPGPRARWTSSTEGRGNMACRTALHGMAHARGLSSAGGSARDPKLTFVGSRMIVVWEDNRRGHPEVWSRMWNGTTWTAEVSPTTPWRPACP